MLTGPIFRREAVTVPRSFRHFAVRSGSVLALFVLMYTADKAVLGFGSAGGPGASARFGAMLFQLFALVELTLAMFFGLLFAAGTVSQEKDRGTLVLLLMTDLRNTELVLGKLASGLLAVGVVLVTSIPAFFLLPMLGGVTAGQIGQAMAICAAAAVAAGSWGTLVAYWREKTFQTLAIGVIGIVAYVGLIELITALVGTEHPVGRAIGLLDPYRAMVPVLNPFASTGAIAFAAVPVLLVLATVVNAITLWRLRVWNPPRHVHEAAKAVARETAVERIADRSREVWETPVLWREIRTRAYGRKVAVIKAAYIAIAVAAAWFLAGGVAGEPVLGKLTLGGIAFVGLAFISLMLVNAQSVTSLTTERDGRTLELLLVTEIDAREFVFGKLLGALYNTKELILVPLLLIGYLVVRGEIAAENAVYVGLSFLVLVLFAAMLGLHAAVTYSVSRSAIANSLGTLFFLFVGIALFLLLLVEARSSFGLQLQSFLVFIVAGSIVLGASLTQRNPAPALWLGAAALPFLTFYAIASFLIDAPLAATLAVLVAYGFTTVAMLVPAMSDFDVALGRSRGEK
ncbi:MAG: ABC transporter permease [Planctomycetaceae bacterium]